MSEPELDPEYFKKKLIELREELEALQSTGAEAAQIVELDQARVGRLSRMDALQAQSMSVETRRRRELQLRNIGAALRRIEVGDFGICTECAEPINPERLEFDPTATLCFDCAQAREQPR
jgi:DnaK suppressor protein